MKKVLIIGAGASGLCAAVAAAGAGAEVTVLEAEEKPCRKLLRTGNGRCNLANSADTGSAYEGSGAGFPGEVLSHCSVGEILGFFEKLGLELRCLDGWYYPACEEARAVADVLLSEAERLKVRIKLSERVETICRMEDGYSAKTATWTYKADALILACGSPAGLKTPGTVLPALQNIRLSATPFVPVLLPLKTSEAPCRIWAGARARAEAGLYVEDRRASGKGGAEGLRPVYTEAGQIQFTSAGISGIPVFNLSFRAGRALREGRRAEVRLNFLAGLQADRILWRLEERQRTGTEQELFGLLHAVLPEKLAAGLAREGARQNLSLRELLCGFRIRITGIGDLPEAQAAAGGISSAEISSETLESRLYPGLFVTGEALEPVGHCGGFNLQFAWASGLLAGRAASGALGGACITK